MEILGIDVGGSGIKGAPVETETGVLLAPRYRLPTPENSKPKVVADIIGDWREEIITSLPGELRIYSTNIPALNRKVCLIQNRQYRLGIANSTMGYFYPPQLGIDKNYREFH